MLFRFFLLWNNKILRCSFGGIAKIALLEIAFSCIFKSLAIGLVKIICL